VAHNQQDVSSTAAPKLGERFDQAFAFASRTHHLQVRKNSGEVPYMAHLLAVSSLVLEAGGDEDLAIAALLHDAAEDQGGEAMLAEIGKRFGPRVMRIVQGCSDTFVLPKPPWYERKRAYVAHVRDVADADVCMVSAADKLHNARSILSDHYRIGDVVFDRFKASKDQTLWYYREMVEALRSAIVRNRLEDGQQNEGVVRLVDELHRVVQELLQRTPRGEEEPCRE
jgi:(p)ppGpp synthase/HD superfamily hydrolase